MLIQSSVRLLRRPQFQLTFVCIILLLLLLANHSGTVSFPLLQSLKTSPYYTKEGESRYYSWKTPSFFPPVQSDHRGTPVNLCQNFPTHLLDKIQVIMKTGAGERAKTTAHLENVSSCLTNLLIFSDLDEAFGSGHQAIDVLADVAPLYNNSADFAAYSEQIKAHAEGKPVGYSQEGWQLDKFKFLAMVDKAYQMRPKADWYVFIEADVYYFWGM